MDIFLSWSGFASNIIAKELSLWIPTVIQAAKPYYSSSDIEKGKRWSSEIAKKLSQSEFGILVLTNENIDSPWILFEAGALSKNLDNSKVIPILFGIKPTDLEGPLSQFQSVKFSKKDFYSLLSSINKSLKPNTLNEKVLSEIFEKMWDDFEKKILRILQKDNISKIEPRTERDILEEILSLVRLKNLKDSKQLLRPKIFKSIGEIDWDEYQSVTFDKENQTIDFWNLENKEIYFVSLDELSSTGNILDFIFQIRKKGWCTSGHISDFLSCLAELSIEYLDVHPEIAFSPNGSHMSINWKDRMYVKIKSNSP